MCEQSVLHSLRLKESVFKSASNASPPLSNETPKKLWEGCVERVCRNPDLVSGAHSGSIRVYTGVCGIVQGARRTLFAAIRFSGGCILNGAGYILSPR